MKKTKKKSNQKDQEEASDQEDQDLSLDTRNLVEEEEQRKLSTTVEKDQEPHIEDREDLLFALTQELQEAEERGLSLKEADQPITEEEEDQL